MEEKEALNKLITTKKPPEELLRQTPEYQVCWKLELWKKREQQKFKAWVDNTKKKQLKQFESECKAREEQQNDIFHHKQKEIEQLEGELSKNIRRVEDRENKIKFFEKELERRKKELESDFKRKVRDIEHQGQLAREECSHKVNLLSNSILDMEKEVQSFRNKCSHLEERNKVLIEKNTDLQQKYVSTNHIQLQNDNIDLRRRIEEALSSKKNYKIQWKRSINLIERLKKKHQERTQKLLDKIVVLQNNQSVQPTTLLNMNIPGVISRINSGVGNTPVSSGNISPVKNSKLSEIENNDKQLDDMKDELEKLKVDLEGMKEKKTEIIENKKEMIRKNKNNNRRLQKKKKVAEKKMEEPHESDVRKVERDVEKKKQLDIFQAENDNPSINPNKDPDSTEEWTNSFEDGDNPLMGSPQKVKKRPQIEDRDDLVMIIPSMNDQQSGGKRKRKKISDGTVQQKLRALVKKKARLLHTGVYNEESKIIQQINAQIENLQM